MSNSKDVCVGSLATVVIAIFAVLTFYFEFFNNKEQPTPKEPIISGEHPETNTECKVLSSNLSAPIMIEKGLCFRNSSNNQKATIKLVTRNAIRYTNYKGTFRCSIGETCSFGWLDAPKFHVISGGYSDGVVYIVGEN